MQDGRQPLFLAGYCSVGAMKSNPDPELIPDRGGTVSVKTGSVCFFFALLFPASTCFSCFVIGGAVIVRTCCLSGAWVRLAFTSQGLPRSSHEQHFVLFAKKEKKQMHVISVSGLKSPQTVHQRSAQAVPSSVVLLQPICPSILRFLILSNQAPPELMRNLG